MTKDEQQNVWRGGALLLATLLLVGLALRLVVWRWREFYPLGGDEQEYLGQALLLLRERRYVELQLMRPPLYGLFLAASILLVDSLVQNLRLLQALISAATVIPVWLLAAELADWYRMGQRVRLLVPGLAALFCALNYTLAANATELLAETLFLAGLTTLFWLLVRAAARRHLLSAGVAGGVLGLLCLTRSVALPLLPLGALWLLLAAKNQLVQPGRFLVFSSRFSVLSSLFFVLCSSFIILPWTARNYVTYGGLILIDTTGAENLWLDNDPAGREAVKAQLYALGEDRLTRQRLAMERGLDVITADPGRFVGKSWGELCKFFALEYTDDMRQRQAIWLPPAEVWTRLLLGDGLWLLLILGGTVGLVATQPVAENASGDPVPRSRFPIYLADPIWLFIPWALYVVLTALIFHVELRYRLPLYPVLLPYAALVLARPHCIFRRHWSLVLRLLPAVGVIMLLLLHRPYPALAWQLGWKHLALARAERALERHDAVTAYAAAQVALNRDPESVLARVALARATLLSGDPVQAEVFLQEAIEMLPAHPQPHLLRGDLLRQRGDQVAANQELRYETASLQDLQTWSWHWFSSPPPTALDVGGGLDLGMVRGFYPSEADGWRWTRAVAQVRLAVPADSQELHVRLASGRPEAAPTPWIEILVEGESLGRFAVADGWQNYTLILPTKMSVPDTDSAPSYTHASRSVQSYPISPPEEPASIVVELRSTTFTPRSYDPASADGRVLGVMVDQVAVERQE